MLCLQFPKFWLAHIGLKYWENTKIDSTYYYDILIYDELTFCIF